MMLVNEADIPRLAAAYEAGSTYEELALDYGVSIKQMQTALRPHITPRRKGQQKGKPHKYNINRQPAGSDKPALPTKAKRGAQLGHRRRSRY